MATVHYEPIGLLHNAPLLTIPETQEPAADETNSEPAAKRQRMTYQCDVCDTTYTERKSLLRHQRTPAHQRRAHQTPAVSQYACGDCGKLYTRNDNLQRHVQEVHKGQRRGHAEDGRDEDMDDSHLDHENAGPMPHIVELSSPVLGDSSSETVWDEGKEAHPISWDEMPPEMLLRDGNATTESTIAESQSSSQSSFSSVRSTSPELHHSTGGDVRDSSESTHRVGDEMEADPIDQSDRASVLSVRSITSMFSDLSIGLPFRSGLRSLRFQRNPRFKPLLFVQPCPLCGLEFGKLLSDGQKVREHLEVHLHEIDGKQPAMEISCLVCRINFVHIKDLEWHLQCVDSLKPACGFDFQHAGTCTGHHPPSIDSAQQTDHHAFEQSLRNWETAQLASFRKYISDFAQGRIPTNAPNYEEPHLQYRRSTGSLCSSRSYVTFRSLPFYITGVKERDGVDHKHQYVTKRPFQDIITKARIRNIMTEHGRKDSELVIRRNISLELILAVKRRDSTYVHGLFNYPGVLRYVLADDLRLSVRFAFWNQDSIMLRTLLSLPNHQSSILDIEIIRITWTFADFLHEEEFSSTELEDLDCPGMGLCVVELLLSGAVVPNAYDRAAQALSLIERPMIFDEIAAASQKKGMLEGRPMATILCAAAYFGKTDLVHRLLDLGMDVNISSERYMDVWDHALAAAVEGRNYELMDTLIERGANSTKFLTNYVTSGSCDSLPAEIVEKLARVADIDLHENLYFRVAAAGVVPALRALLQRNVAVDVCDRDGRTALFHAVRNKHLEAVELLVSHGADPTRRTLDGSTPLSCAVSLAAGSPSDECFRIAELLSRSIIGLERQKQQGSRTAQRLWHLTSSSYIPSDGVLLGTDDTLDGVPLGIDDTLDGVPLRLEATGMYHNAVGQLFHLLRPTEGNANEAVNFHSGCDMSHCGGFCEEVDISDCEDDPEIFGGRPALANIHCPDCREYYLAQFERHLHGSLIAHQDESSSIEHGDESLSEAQEDKSPLKAQEVESFLKAREVESTTANDGAAVPQLKGIDGSVSEWREEVMAAGLEKMAPYTNREN